MQWKQVVATMQIWRNSSTFARSPDMSRLILGIIALAVLSAVQPVYAEPAEKHRLVVLTDMGADPDDQQSLVRLLLYTNQVDIEGLIATTSVWQKNKVRPEFIVDIIRAYGVVRPNLALHEAGFPESNKLLAMVKSGLAEYGMQGVGDGKDSEGSEWILEALEREDDRPLWISVWGGVNTLAQALHQIDRTRSPDEIRRLISKLRVYTISDQDDSGAWIRKTFPDLFYIVSPGDDYGSATWSAINTVAEGIDNQSISNPWLAVNIQQGHGALGAAYPDVSWGMEGDTPSYLSLIPNGLNDPDRPDVGGWGGRYELRIPDIASLKEGGSDVVLETVTREIWTDTSDTYTPYLPNEFGRAIRKSEESISGHKATLLRWRDDFQNDFAARMDWSTASYEEANHPPVPALEHPRQIVVKSGEGFELDASGTTDPDGDSLSYLWFHYPEAGSYKELIEVQGAENTPRAYIVAPEVEKDETAHFILKVTDKGTHPLSRYQRVVVTIAAKSE
jgi:hypothetical protein